MVNIINLNDLNGPFDESFDLFVCFCSFEQRSISIASHISTNNFAKALIFVNEVRLENTDQHLHVLSQIFTSKAEVVPLNLSSPIDVADKMIEWLAIINSGCKINRIFVDITTFTHETLLIFFAILNKNFNSAQIICGYNNAKDYSIDNKNLEAKWLSRGIGEVRSILGYSGTLKPSRSNLLIVIVGYEYERAARIIDEISPDHLIIGYNIESNATTEMDRNANEDYARLLKKLAAYYGELPSFVVPSDDPYGAYQAICQQLDSIGTSSNIAIVPMNNKLSTLGVALVGQTRPEIQICYAPALIYNTSSYSEPGDSCYVFPFNVPEENTEF
ncbi:hypothetical protein AALA82_20280 [Oscillospiraceae bacterium 50-16]